MIIDKENGVLKITEIGADCEVIPPFPLRGEIIKDVKYLDLSFNRLRSLDGLDCYTNLETLVLDNNNLTDNIELPCLPHLKVLSLNKNYLCNLKNFLELLKISTPKLEFLSLLSNPCCPNEMVNSCFTETDYQRYRCQVLAQVPTLHFLDSLRVTRKERRISIKSKRTLGPLDEAKLEEMFPTELYSRKSAEHYNSTARYGRVVIKYRGKNSEGNRFIRDHDL